MGVSVSSSKCQSDTSSSVSSALVKGELEALGVVRGLGMSVPKNVIDNHHFASYLETSDEWITERTGIKERRWVDSEETLVNLAEPAVRDAISASGLESRDIDGIIVATSTPDNSFPSTACELQARLGCERAFAFDMAAACSGFLYAMVTAQGFLRNGAARNIVVVGAEIFSRVVDREDRGTCILFGDGAGAIVLSSESSDSKRGILAAKLFSDGKFGPNLTLGSNAGRFIAMAGREVFKVAVRSIADSSAEVLEASGYSVADLDWYVSHQANERILQAVGKQLGIDSKKILMNVERFGNTSAASVPLLLAESVDTGKIKPGDLVMISAFGGGATWGAILIRW